MTSKETFTKKQAADIMDDRANKKYRKPARTAKQIESDIDADPGFQKELRAAHAFAAKWDKLRKLDYTTPGLILKTAEFYAGQPSAVLLEIMTSRYEKHMGNNIDLKRVNEQYLRMQNALLKRILIITAGMNPEAMRGYIEAQIVEVIDEEK